MPDKTLAIILAGGSGSQLHPLTAHRTKPAVPFGGQYRIIDFTLANCLHSGLRQVLVLTQYKSHSLQKHLRDGWSIFNPELGEYITPVPPQMRTGEKWYSGAADAMYQNLYLIERSDARRVIILSGDHIYRMDYAEMVRSHRSRSADLTIACMETELSESLGLGFVRTGDAHRVCGFEQSPGDPPGLQDCDGAALASMGIYVFERELLIDMLRKDQDDPSSGHDLAGDLLPRLVQDHPVYAYVFGGRGGRVTQDRYWCHLGTIDAFYEANMDLLKPVPPLNLYQEDWNIRTYQGQNPPARTVPGASGTEGVFVNSILAGGTIIAGGGVNHSILFAKVRVDDNAIVERSILFEGVHIGEGAHVQNCIIDKHVRVPAGEQIGFDANKDRERFTVSPNGIVAVPKGFRF